MAAKNCLYNMYKFPNYLGFIYSNMPKTATYPILYDDALTIDMAKLKKWGYLQPEQVFQAQIKWSRNGEAYATITIRVNNITPHNYIELDYSSNGRPIRYKINLASLPSNLGKGEILYFICPKTYKRCRKLYLSRNYFLHRDAFHNCMYECQTKSKSSRRINKQVDTIFKPEKLQDELLKKHFRTHYKGKKTKRYTRILQQLKQAENVDFRGFDVYNM